MEAGMSIPPQVESAASPVEPPLSAETRYLLVEVGKLSASVAWLIGEVKQLKENYESLRRDVNVIQAQITFVKGILFAMVGMGLVGGYLFNGKIDAVIALMRTLAK